MTIYWMQTSGVYVHALDHNSNAINDNNYNNQANHNNINNQYITRRQTDTAGSIPDRNQLHHAHQSRFYQLVRVEDRG